MSGNWKKAAHSAPGRTFAYLAAIVAGKGLSLALMPVVTRALTPAEFGALELLIAISDVGGVLLGLGLADTLFRFAADAPRRVTATVFAMAMALAATGGLTMLAAIPMIESWMPPQIETLDLQLVCGTLMLTSLVQVPLAWLRFRDAAWTFLAVEAAKCLVQAFVVVALLELGYGITGILAGAFIANLAIAAYLAICLIRHNGFRPHPPLARGMLLYALPLVASGSFGFVLGSFDRWMLAPHISLETLGHYGLAAKFAMFAAFAMQPFDMWWFPKRLGLCRTSSGRERSADIIRLGCVLACGTTFAAMIAGPLAIEWLTPPEYHAAADILPWLLLAKLLHQYSNLLNVGCYAQPTAVLPMTINAAAALTVLLGYLCLIPGFGLQGAIAALILAQAVRLLLFTVIGERLVQIANSYWHLAIPMLLLAMPLITKLDGKAAYIVELYALSGVGIMLAFIMASKAVTGSGPDDRISDEKVCS